MKKRIKNDFYKGSGMLLALAGALHASPAFSQNAGQRLLETVVNKWEETRYGSAPKTAPVPAKGAVDAWGDPPKSVVVLTEAEAARFRERRAQGQQAGTTPLAYQSANRQQTQGVDERFQDERFRRVPTKGRAEGGKPQSENVNPFTNRPYQEVKTLPIATSERPTVSAAPCSNVSRAWEGAANLAARGNEQKAYDAYLRLLSNCGQESELKGTASQATKNLGAENLERLASEPVLASPRLEAAFLIIRLHQMFAANKAGDDKVALEHARSIHDSLVASKDVGALEVYGWLEQRAGQYRKSEQLFRAALKVERENDSARQGLLFSLLAQKKLDAAEREFTRLSAEDDIVMGEIRLAQAQRELQNNRYKEALARIKEAQSLGVTLEPGVLELKAWAHKGAEQYKEAAEIFEVLLKEKPLNPTLQQAYVDSLRMGRQFDKLTALKKSPEPVATRASEALQAHHTALGRRDEAALVTGERAEGYGSQISAGIGVRSKSGEVGKGRFTETEMLSTEGTVAVNETTTFKMALKISQLNDSERTVQNRELQLKGETRIGDVKARVGVGIAQAEGKNRVSLEAAARTETDTGHLEIGVRSAPKKDSVRSYIGAEVLVPTGPVDEVTKEAPTKKVQVGQATETALYASGSTMLDEGNVYKLNWATELGVVTSANAPNNAFYGADVSLEKNFTNENWSWLSAGPYAGFKSYRYDQSGFDGAQAGYFSPKLDVTGGLGFNAMTKEGGKSLYRVTGRMGLASRKYNGASDVGVYVKASTGSMWLLTPHLLAGVGASVQVAPGSRDVGVKLGVAIPFEKRTKLYGSDLSAVNTP